LRNLREAWANAVELDIQVERVESNPQLVQIVPPNEVVILVSLEIVVANTRGTVNLCIPFNTIERIGSKLTSNSWIGYASSRSNATTATQIESLIDESQVEVVVDLVKTDIRAVDLINLQVGDIITTDKDFRSPLEVSVAGVGKFEARAGSFKGRKAVEVVGIIESKKREQLLQANAAAIANNTAQAGATTSSSNVPPATAKNSAVA
jgi:flagellar motor switch protein FliM